MVAGSVLKRDGALVGGDLRRARDNAATSLDYLLQHTEIQPQLGPERSALLPTVHVATERSRPHRPPQREPGHRVPDKEEVKVRQPRAGVAQSSGNRPHARRIRRRRSSRPSVRAAPRQAGVLRSRGSRTSRSRSPTATTRRCSPRRRRSRRPGRVSVTVFDAANDPKKQLAAAADGDHLEAVRRDHRPADLRAAADPDDPVGDQERHQGRQHRPDPRREPGHRRAAGRRALRQRRLRPDRDRQEAGPARRQGVRGAEGEPVQGRLPVLGQGVLARHRDPQGLRPGDRRATTSRSSPRARPSTTRRTRSRPRRRCSRRSRT